MATAVAGMAMHSKLLLVVLATFLDIPLMVILVLVSDNWMVAVAQEEVSLLFLSVDKLTDLSD